MRSSFLVSFETGTPRARLRSQPAGQLCLFRRFLNPKRRGSSSVASWGWVRSQYHLALGNRHCLERIHRAAPSPPPQQNQINLVPVSLQWHPGSHSLPGARNLMSPDSQQALAFLILQYLEHIQGKSVPGEIKLCMDFNFSFAFK